MQHQSLALLCSVGLVSLVSGIARAQNTAGALQLGLGTDVVTYGNTSATRSLQNGDVTDDISTLRWGFGDRTIVNLEGGYGLGDSMVIGGIVGLGGRSDKNEPDGNDGWTKTSTFNLLIAPKFDYMILPGQAIRPFFGGALGLIYQSETDKLNLNLGNANVTQTTRDWSATGLAIMPRVGVRCFLTPGFSIDPAFTFLWIPTASGSIQPGNNSARYDLSANGYTLGLTVAVSGWVGL